MTNSRELAAQAWCKEKTSYKEMDIELAEAFADILAEQEQQHREEIKSLLNILQGISYCLNNKIDIDKDSLVSGIANLESKYGGE